ncbi:hypothetical protein ACWFMI_23490 [Nocardiopsis terrae]|uniref:hypothetical protein n=1 Tax=Streptomyces sp. NPDC057554 TaxID=3350538 RepID=UPI0036AA6FBF
MTTYDGDVVVAGALSAANLRTIRVRITPEARVPTSLEITGLNLGGNGRVQALATAHTSVPGTRVLEVSVSSVTANGCLVWIYRTNTAETNISVTFWREP